ncbi:MAG: hypothetical protein Aurels2KO_35310 [Aureliella sp.]
MNSKDAFHPASTDEIVRRACFNSRSVTLAFREDILSRQENRSDNTVPNLYKMLGLRGPRDSVDVIRAKIDRLLKKAEAIAATDPKKAEQARKLATVARKQLCDPKRKTTFDAVWQTQYGKSALAGERANRDTKRSQMRPKFSALLPKGSPTEPFDMAAFLQGEPAPRFDREQFAQLVASVAATEQSFPRSESTLPETLESPVESIPQPQEKKSTVVAPSAAPRLGKQLREKRKKNFLLPVLGLLGCLAIVFGLIAFLLRPVKPDNTVAENGLAARDGLEDAQQETKPRPPRRSGLPQVGMPVDDGETVVDLQPSQDAPATADDMELFLPDSSQLDSLNPAVNEPEETGMQPADPGLPVETMDPAKPPSTAPENIEPLLAGVLQRAAEYKYDDAMNQIAEVRGSGLSDDQFAQLKRVEAILLLAQQGHASLVTQVRGMSAGESFLVGTSAQVGFVSGDSERISIRLRGQSREYTYNKLPPGLLYALLDMALDNANATALAARGAFVLLQPNRTDATIQKARELLVTAAGSGAFEEDLPKVIDDFGL